MLRLHKLLKVTFSVEFGETTGNICCVELVEACCGVSVCVVLFLYIFFFSGHMI